MPKFIGACHCGSVGFEIDTEEPLGPYFRCNCSLCSRKGAAIGSAPRRALSITRGEDCLSLYRWNTGEAEHFFCKHCGIYTHHVMRGRADFIGVNMACIEGVNVFDLEPMSVDDGARLWSLVGSS